ncbi:hypothetical protein ANCDUO_03199 [Ancylostoma duodenale]|uniref:TANGO6 N-terminal domain-containing protein n=1 Tax=Ancylostoma duodenale TaxID=51022 RepID=A0A0C2DUJ2_9BILA|nr:hypothetical protein ANCDUO_03199 [Ancylostoma duodenale]
MKSDSKLEKAFYLLEKCTSVDKDLVWTSSNCDPFAAILSCLEEKEKIADELKTAYEKTAEYPLVSVKHSALLSSAFQFFILTCVSPYLDQGVGIPLQLRSHVIKSWERHTSDPGFRKDQLRLAAKCIAALLDCNDTIRSNLLTRYCSDIVCVFEQLMMLDASDNMASVYEEVLKFTDPQLLVCTFLGLLKPRNGVKPPKQLTNTPFLSTFAKQLALPPKNSRKMAYYENVASQFIQLIREGKFSRENVSVLFSMFAEEMRGRNPVAAGIFIDDVLFKPWEDGKFSRENVSVLFSMFAEGMRGRNPVAAGIFIDDILFKPWECVAVLLSLLSVGEDDKKSNLMSDISIILKNALNDVDNLSDFLLAFISDASSCFELVEQRMLVQLVGEKSCE